MYIHIMSSLQNGNISICIIQNVPGKRNTKYQLEQKRAFFAILKVLKKINIFFKIILKDSNM